MQRLAYIFFLGTLFSLAYATDPSWFSSVNLIELTGSHEQSFPAPCDGYFITNANITTFDPNRPRATRLRTLGKHIAWVGDSFIDYLVKIRNQIRPCAIINARGRRVGPAIWDSHVHLLRAAIEAGCQIYDAENARSTEEFLFSLQEGLENCESDELIAITGGFNRGSIGGFPTLSQLDAILPDQPFIGAQRYTVPNEETLIFEGPGFVNSVALEILNDAGFALDADGTIPANKLNNILTFFRNQMTLQDQIKSTKRLFAYLHRKGIIGGLDVAGNGFAISNGYNAIRAMAREQDLDMAIGLGLRAWMRPGGIQGTVDHDISRLGSVLGTHDALWNAGLGESFFPTADRGNGTALTTHLQIVRRSLQGSEWALFINTEAPSENAGLMTALENVKQSDGIPPHLWSVEHAYGLTRSQLEWLDDNKIFLSVDGSRFLTGQDVDDFRGPPLRTAVSLSADPLIAINTDGRNAAPINWWITAQFCADGRNATGHLINPNETIPIEQVYKYGSYGTARKVRQHDIRGSLSAGKLADLVVWKDDPLRVPKANIHLTEAKFTIFRGRLVFRQ